MEIGQKLLLARQEAGLSQRQLCGEEITRNMLSQIEHGTAHPSMKTLRYLAGRLGKPVSYFLDDEAEPAPAAQLLEALTLLQKAETAIAQEKWPYARELLEQVTMPELARKKLLLQAKIPGADIPSLCEKLPSLDEELLLRAQGALSAGQWNRCLHLLEAMEAHTAPNWQLLRGRLAMEQQDYRAAAEYFHPIENAYPEETAELLERCYREREDYKQAYFYACRQKTKTR